MIKHAQSIARSYAQSLFALISDEGFAQQADFVQSLQKAFSDLSEMCDKSELGSFFNSPAFDLDEKFKVLEEVKKNINMSDVFERFVHVLIQNGHFSLLGNVEQDFEQEILKSKKKIPVRVTSAAALNETQASRLSYVLSQKLGQDVLVEYSVDPSLIGGVKAQIGSTVYDSSVLSQLSQLQKEIA